MSLDLGDPVPLSITVRNAANVPENAGAVVLTITLPDGTTATPAVTGASGVYTLNAPYIAVQSGRHTVRWVATGANSTTLSDVFNVTGSDPGFIISLAEARAGLGLVNADTVRNEDLRSYIAAATPIMEDIVGPILRTTRTETYDGGGTAISLLWSPIISVSSVTESYGTFARALTVQDVFAGSGLDSYGYTVDLVTGVVTRRAAGVAMSFPAGRRNIQVTYVSGRATLGANLLLATQRLVRHLWQQAQQGFRPTMGTPNEAMGSTPSGFAVPKAVLEICAGDT
jgi:uncharacterized repeat protein (TIGR01451 family)